MRQRAESEAGLPVGVWLALAFGLGLRVWYFLDLSAQPWYGYPLVDSLTNERIALRLLEEGATGGFFRPPLYPVLLAALFRLFGRQPAVVVWFQFLLGLAALVPAYRLGVRWFGPGAALAGAWIGACYPLRIFFEGESLDVTVFTFLFVLATWKLWQALEQEAPARLLISGALYGAAVLTRPNALIALPFIAAGAVLAFPRARPRFAVWAAGVALAVAPATAHNLRAEGAFIPVAANGGVNFFLGNAPGASGLTPLPPGLRWEEAMLLPVREGRLTLAGQDRWWYARARREILAAPLRWLRLLGAKSALFVNAAESGNNKALSRFTAVSFPVRHYRWWFGALAGLALLGCVTRPGPGAAFLGCLVAGFGLSVVLFFVAERYRLPLVPVLAAAAAAGAGELIHAACSRDARRGAALLGVCAAAGIAIFPDWLGAGRERINADFQIGQVRLMRGETERALESLRRARAADPRDPDVLNSLGAALAGQGDLDGAEGAYLQALQLGDFAEVWFNLGVIAERRGPGHEAAAAQRYRRALALNPVDARSRANLEALERGARGAAPPAP